MASQYVQIPAAGGGGDGAAEVTTTVTGEFDGQDVDATLVKVGSIVTMHLHTFSRVSGADFTYFEFVIPAAYRPVVDCITTFVYDTGGKKIGIVDVYSDGTLEMWDEGYDTWMTGETVTIAPTALGPWTTLATVE